MNITKEQAQLNVKNYDKNIKEQERLSFYMKVIERLIEEDSKKGKTSITVVFNEKTDFALLDTLSQLNFICTKVKPNDTFYPYDHMLNISWEQYD